jgi:hypothetical protein
VATPAVPFRHRRRPAIFRSSLIPSNGRQSRRDPRSLRGLLRAFTPAPDAPGYGYHFYVLGPDDQILRALDLRLPSDEAAMAHARTLLSKGEAVEILRGALVIGQVGRTPRSVLTA